MPARRPRAKAIARNDGEHHDTCRQRTQDGVPRSFVLAGALVGVLLLASAAVWTTLYKPAVAVEQGAPVQLEVPKGASTTQIAERARPRRAW